MLQISDTSINTRYLSNMLINKKKRCANYPLTLESSDDSDSSYILKKNPVKSQNLV